MEQTDTTATDSPGRTERSPELIRPLEGRMIAGVAKGVADNFGISEWIPRVFFVITAFMGGLGVALYAAAWAFIRSEDETESPAETFFRGASGSRAWLGIGLIVIAGMIILSEFTILAGEVIWAGVFLVVGLLLYLGYIPGWAKTDDRSSPPTEESSESKDGVQPMTTTDTKTTKNLVDEPPGDSAAGGSTTPPPRPTPTPPNLPPARPKERSILGRLTLGLTAIGLGVLAILDNIESLAIDAEPYHYLALAVTIVGAGLVVGAFAGRAKWLILLLAFMIPTLVFSPYFGYDLDRNGDLRTHPVTFAEVASEYEIDIGELVIDLTGLPWSGQQLDLEASVDAGSIVLRLPEDVGIIGTASVDIGQVSERGRSNSGIGDPHLDWDDPGTNGTVLLDAHVSVGNIDVRRSTGG